MPTATFRPKIITKTLLHPLAPRAREVLIGRFGLGTSSEKKTLESIGQKYGITRERVRQIENFALASVRKSDAYSEQSPIFSSLQEKISNIGAIVSEEDVLHSMAKDRSTQNHIYFYLVLCDQFKKHKEDSHFHHRWSTDDALAEEIHQALRTFHGEIADTDLVPESEIASRFLDIVNVPDEYKSPEIAVRWLRVSKVLGRNPLGEWGLAFSPNVNARGIRDYAYLIIRRHGSPMHFTEVADAITKTFGKKAHVATCHNELIKDSRFMLVGRGLYVLSEWGYVGGVVRDVIRNVLEAEGALTKQEIVDKVMKERYVKENTIFVNLQNTRYFKRDDEGRYTVA